MNDFVISNLHGSQNEWWSRLRSIFSPLVTEEIRSTCTDTDELGKYLMTFQYLLSRVPKWNAIMMIEDERKRIIERNKST